MNKDFDAMKKQEQKNNTFDKMKAGSEIYIDHKYWGTHIIPRGVQSVAEAAQDAKNLTTLSRYTGARVDRCQRMTKDTEQFTTHTNMMRTERWQHRSLIQNNCSSTVRRRKTMDLWNCSGAWNR